MSSIPPSPVVEDVPASRDPRARAVLAGEERPKLMPVTISGISSSIGFSANRVPSTVRDEHDSR